MHALLIWVIASVTFILTFSLSYADKLENALQHFTVYVCVFVSMELYIWYGKVTYLSLDLLAHLFILQISVKPNPSVFLLTCFTTLKTLQLYLH